MYGPGASSLPRSTMSIAGRLGVVGGKWPVVPKSNRKLALLSRKGDSENDVRYDPSAGLLKGGRQHPNASGPPLFSQFI
jgi:hypothetical protein